jgi:rhodanese-related sulfurtransferase
VTVVPEISVDELAAHLAAGAPVLDVREPDEYAAGHVPGARLVPLGDIPARAAEVPTDVTVYMICRSGARSHRAAEFLRTVGVDAVNVAGGTLAWADAGRPVAAGPEPQ